VLVAAVKVVASVAVPTVVPTALMHQNTAIATAATVRAKTLVGDTACFIRLSVSLS
jgi:hypothetical protein